MHVVATAGHVDHGKSRLVRALTGQEPDRLEEERRRGLSIELGYAWTSWTGVGDVAFVDVPGHERFLRTMLSGIGPVPAVLLVVAADDPWMPQAAEHLAALSALGVSHGVVAVSRSDLADPSAAVRRTRDELDGTPLRAAPVVPVSAVSGAGLDELRAALATMVSSLPPPETRGDVRLWADRSFHVRGAGTVLTGTLPAGTVSVGDRLSTGTGVVRVRGIQALGKATTSVSAVARVALNVVADDRAAVGRDTVLVTPDAWHFTETVDVHLAPAGREDITAGTPRESVLHLGAVAVPSRVRRLDDRHARLTLTRPLPLRVGDRAILRDPGDRRMWGVTVLDPAPPRLRRRGAAGRRAAALASAAPGLDSELRRRGVASVELLRRIGVPLPASVATEQWLVGEEAASALRRRMAEVVRRHDAEDPLDPGVGLAALAREIGLPSPELVPRLVGPPLRVVDGRVTATPPRDGLPPRLEKALASLERDLAEAPFAAPTADRVAELGLDRRAVGAAVRAGRLVDLGGGIVLLPGAEVAAVERLRTLPQPFTTSQARQALGTSRRVVLPLLARLDRSGISVRHEDDRRSLR
ncbi:MAG TPA: SelB C-terminal domain-containing protein [Nocardioides sp.]|nr:SelB C-terminal domain-containing protein [Nocardioides sp.]